MTPKGFLKALAKALLYFAVYFGWQIIAMNWLSIGATYFLMAKLDLGDPAVIGTAAGYEAALEQINEAVYEILMKYSLHVTLVAGVLTLITFFVMLKMRKKDLFAEVGLTKQPIPRILMLILFGMSLNIFVSILLGMIPFPESWVEAYADSTAIFGESDRVITLLTTLVCAPIVEEVTFRGFVYTRLSRGMPMFAAMLISSWIFGMVHGTMIQMLYAMLLGLMICYVRVKYRSLTACIALHFGFNLFSVAGELLGGMNDIAFYMLFAGSAAVSLILFLHIRSSSEYKIEFGMKDGNEQNG